MRFFPPAFLVLFGLTNLLFTGCSPRVSGFVEIRTPLSNERVEANVHFRKMDTQEQFDKKILLEANKARKVVFDKSHEYIFSFQYVKPVIHRQLRLAPNESYETGDLLTIVVPASRLKSSKRRRAVTINLENVRVLRGKVYLNNEPWYGAKVSLSASNTPTFGGEVQKEALTDDPYFELIGNIEPKLHSLEIEEGNHSFPFQLSPYDGFQDTTLRFEFVPQAIEVPDVSAEIDSLMAYKKILRVIVQKITSILKSKLPDHAVGVFIIIGDQLLGEVDNQIQNLESTEKDIGETLDKRAATSDPKARKEAEDALSRISRLIETSARPRFERQLEKLKRFEREGEQGILTAEDYTAFFESTYDLGKFRVGNIPIAERRELDRILRDQLPLALNSSSWRDPIILVKAIGYADNASVGTGLSHQLEDYLGLPRGTVVREGQEGRNRYLSEARAKEIAAFTKSELIRALQTQGLIIETEYLGRGTQIPPNVRVPRFIQRERRIVMLSFTIVSRELYETGLSQK